MYQFKNLDILAAGLAIFSMFFGAGNIIFPLAIGHHALDQTPFAILGLLLTAVLMPFAGLWGIFLYQGNVKEFFGRLGAKSGLALALLIIALLGPLGSTPRCIALAYSTFKVSFPSISAPFFSAISCGLIFLFAIKKNRLLNLLGYVLTPFLMICLIFIIGKGLTERPTVSMLPSDLSILQSFWHGLKEGYNTMDLLAAFFFAPVILSSLQKKANGASLSNFVLKASVIGAILLAVIYIGFGYVASYHAAQIGTVASEQLLAAIATQILGPQAGLVVGLTAVLACLTTAIALIAAFTEFLYTEIFSKKLNEKAIMIGSLVVTFFIASFEFQGISQFLTPILQTCYPFLILLTILNIFIRLRVDPIRTI